MVRSDKWLPTPTTWWPAFLIALAAKLCQFISLSLEHAPTENGLWYVYGGDAFSYIAPLEALLAGNGYEPDLRMPGYAPPYLLLRLLFSETAALQGLVLLHVIASAAAVVFLARLAFVMAGRPSAFHWTFWTALVAIHANFHDRHILTESFSVFALALAAYQAVRYLQTSTRRYLWVTGITMTWLIFMKPVFLPALGILGIAVLWHWRTSLSKGILNTGILCLPFLLSETAWIVRNAMVHREFRPLTEGVFYPDMRATIRFPLIKLMQTYGLSFIWWDGTSEIRWFNIRVSEEGGPILADKQQPLPAYIYTKACPKDTLDLIASDVLRHDGATDPQEKARVKDAITARCERCAEAFKEERPFDHHVTARANLLRKFLVHTGTPSLTRKPWAELDPIHRAIKIFYVAFYLGIMIPGTCIAAWVLFRRRSTLPWRMVSALLVYSVLIFPLGMRMCESRYTCALYPLALLFFALACSAVHERIRARRIPAVGK